MINILSQSNLTAARVRGFTLIEMLIVLVLISTVMVLAAPSFTSSVKDNRLRTASSDLYSIIRFARAEAIREGVTVHVGAVSANRVAVWKDENSDNALTTEAALREFLMPSDVTVTATPNVAYLAFDGQGFLTAQQVFLVCDDRSGETGRQITLLVSGLAAMEEKTCP